MWRRNWVLSHPSAASADHTRHDRRYALPFQFPAVRGKKLTAAFDGGRLSSDGGVMLLASRRTDGHRREACGRDPRSARSDAGGSPAAEFCGRASSPSPAATRMPTISTGCAPTPPSSLPAGGCRRAGRICDRSRPCRAGRTRRPARSSPDLCDGRPLLRQLRRRRPHAVVLDIDDTVDVVHGHQQLSLFNAHYDERCFLPIHVYDTATGRPVAMILRPGKTPSGVEVAVTCAVWSGHPPALADNPHHHPRRRPLLPAGSG